MTAFKDRVVFITGAASGIGAATAAACKEAGAFVVGADLAEVASVDMAIKLDVSSEAEMENAVAAIMDRFGRIDGVVTCAGISVPGSVEQFDLADWNRALAINLTGTMLTARATLPQMKAAGTGALVTIASIYGMTGSGGNTPYNVTKGGVLQLMRSLAADYGACGVRVNSVSPGLIDTPMTEMLREEGPMRSAFVNMHLLRRAGRAEEVAKVIRFLLSDEASFVTGANIPVDGGFTAAQVIGA